MVTSPICAMRYLPTGLARPDTAIVRLDLIPHWSGQADVTDLMDGTPATLTTGLTVGWDTTAHRYWQATRAKGTGLIAGLASQVVLSPDARQVTDTAGGSTSALNGGPAHPVPCQQRP